MDSHPGLQFLLSTPEFHARYVETVCKWDVPAPVGAVVFRFLSLLFLFQLLHCDSMR